MESWQQKDSLPSAREKLLDNSEESAFVTTVRNRFPSLPSLWSSVASSTPNSSVDKQNKHVDKEHVCVSTDRTRREFKSIDLTTDDARESKCGLLSSEPQLIAVVGSSASSLRNVRSSLDTSAAVSASDSVAASWLSGIRSSSLALALAGSSQSDAVQSLSHTQTQTAAVKATVVNCSFVVVNKEPKMLYKIGLSETTRDAVKQSLLTPKAALPNSTDNRSVRIVLKRVDELVYLRETIFAQFPRVSLPPLPVPEAPDKAAIEEAIAANPSGSGGRIRCILWCIVMITFLIVICYFILLD